MPRENALACGERGRGYTMFLSARNDCTIRTCVLYVSLKKSKFFFLIREARFLNVFFYISDTFDIFLRIFLKIEKKKLEYCLQGIFFSKIELIFFRFHSRNFNEIYITFSDYV